MSDFGEISYDFGAINDAGTGLKAEAMNITSALEDMEKKFRDFVTSHWTGSEASEAFSHVQGNWRQQSDELMMTLAQLGTKTVDSGAGMQDTDILAAKMLMG
ncbi:WXG100 family type VII secretion target [Nocardia sp. NPDC004068]|uniref:WXG100 family type VII secretion target n=1 Tax=Nocardia sp. NPDC004068 TaxID=3364303 RepID=UPI00369F7D0C